MTTPQQLDLFSSGGAAPPLPRRVEDPRRLPDAALIAAIPRAGQLDAPGLAREAARRGLSDAVPALESLCRRFAGFGREHEIAEQTAALGALAALGGKAATEAVTRLIVSDAVAGPGRTCALEAAAALACQLPPERIAAWLRDDDPAVRAAACGIARTHPAVIAVLIDLLTDLHPPVVQAAALALSRLGQRQGTGVLLRMLAAEPTPTVIAALGSVAGEDECVRLGQIALTHPDLAPAVLAALDECDVPRAAVVAAGVRRRLGLSI